MISWVKSLGKIEHEGESLNALAHTFLYDTEITVDGESKNINDFFEEHILVERRELYQSIADGKMDNAYDRSDLVSVYERSAVLYETVKKLADNKVYEHTLKPSRKKLLQQGESILMDLAAAEQKIADYEVERLRNMEGALM